MNTLNQDVSTTSISDAANQSKSTLPAKAKPIDSLRSGALRSEIAIALQTRAAGKLWHGRRESMGGRKPALIGIPKFASMVRGITDAAAQDDPYADWWLLRLQEGLQDARDKMQRFAETVDQYIDRSIPEGLTVGDALSIDAEQAEARFATPFGFMAAYVVADFDRVARKILLARHIALLDRANSERMLSEGVKIVRVALSRVYGYRYTGVQRKDLLANNAAAQRALAAMGKCPDAVVAGEQRSDFAPVIRSRKSLAHVSEEPDAEFESQQLLDLSEDSAAEHGE